MPRPERQRRHDGAEIATRDGGAWLPVGLMVLAGVLASCRAQEPAPEIRDEPAMAVPATTGEPREQPAPHGPWRMHVLERCRRAENPPGAVENCLALSRNLYRDHEGSDAMMELELCLFEHGQHGLVLLTLGQLYLLGGQGDPELLPSEGPAADVGDWSRNRARLLKRAGELLDRARAARPDDAIVDYLRADVATARGDAKAADSLYALAQLKCTLPRSVATVRQLQRLNRYPAYLLTTLSPEYPRSALEKRITGDVVLDLLISPRGTVHQVTTIDSPAESLTRAAAGAARAARYRPAKIGRYPVWSWLQITAKYSLDD